MSDVLPVVQHPMSAPNISRARSREDFPGLYAVSLPARPFMGARRLLMCQACHREVVNNITEHRGTLGLHSNLSGHTHDQNGCHAWLQVTCCWQTRSGGASA